MSFVNCDNGAFILSSICSFIYFLISIIEYRKNSIITPDGYIFKPLFRGSLLEGGGGDFYYMFYGNLFLKAHRYLYI